VGSGSATVWRIGGSSPGRGWKFSPPCPHRVWGPPSLLSNGLLPWEQSSRSVKLTTLPSTAEVKNAWPYNSTPQYVLMAWCSVRNSTETTLPYLFLAYHLYLDFPSVRFRRDFHTETWFAFLLSPLCSARPDQLILPEFMTLIIFFMQTSYSMWVSLMI
jgi:hypothetical protein